MPGPAAGSPTSGSATRKRPPAPTPRRSTSARTTTRRRKASRASAARPERCISRSDYCSAKNFSAASAPPSASSPTWVPPGKRTMRFSPGIMAKSRSPYEIGMMRSASPCRIEHRHLYLSDAQVGAELVLHQVAHREKRIARRRDIERRCVGRVEHHAGDRLLGRERDRDAGAERLAPQRDPCAGIARGRERIDGARIVDQPVLGRRTGRAAIAAIRERDQARAVGGDAQKARDASAPARRRCRGSRSRPAFRRAAADATRSPARRRRCRARPPRPAEIRPPRAVRERSGKYISERWATYISPARPA